ncbi:MAG: AAA family ATPase [Saprospiraceae bacterium]|nr:AAA family ATPase [Candidatus Opimibacter iunctus]
MASVLNEILEWSQDRPHWQRDALRRLVIQGELSSDDVVELVEMCKSKFGLAARKEAQPLSNDHIPVTGATLEPVSLVSIFHHQGVNALANDQLLSFSPRLTIVYGDNGSGKTGYSRILKNACRARGQEKILGNVIAGAAPPTPSVRIYYRVGDEGEPIDWNGDPEDKVISRISVFDTQSASIYLTEKTDVAYRPYGLDLFDKLTQICKSVRLSLEAEQRELRLNTIGHIQSQVSESTQVGKLLAGLNSLSKSEDIRTLAALSSDEEARINYLEKSLQELQSNNQDKLIQLLSLKSKRVHTLINHLKTADKVLSKGAVEEIFKVKAAGLRKNKEAKELREATFPSSILPGTGNEIWKTLWEAASNFSQENAYPGFQFPFTEHEAVCVLCQQNLSESAKQRLKQLKTYVISTTERELHQLRERYTGLKKTFTDLSAFPESIKEILNEISIEDEPIATEMKSALQLWEARQDSIIKALSEHTEEELTLTEIQVSYSRVFGLVEQIESRIKTLQSTSQATVLKQMQGELSELKARKILSLSVDLVINEIERLKKLAAYNLCIDETKTQAITQQSSIITKKVVSQRLKDGFQTELRNLRFRHIEVELKEMGGSEGVFYHKLVLTRAQNIDLPKVVSEGEQRCLSIAAFFAELTSADDQSGIVFDDPVSSLDFRWRNDVARRLVEES